MICKLATRAPLAEGVNITLMINEPFTGMLGAGAVFVPKSVGFTPLNVKLEMFSGAVPVLVSVTDNGLLATPVCWLGNAIDVPLSVTAG